MADACAWFETPPNEQGGAAAAEGAAQSLRCTPAAEAPGWQSRKGAAAGGGSAPQLRLLEIRNGKVCKESENADCRAVPM